MRLARNEQTVVVLAVAALVGIAIALRVVSLAELIDRVARGRVHRTWKTRLAGVPAIRLLALVEAAAHRLPWPNTCLQRSVAAAWLLRQSGRSCTVCIGIRTPLSDGFVAHSWVAVTDDGSESPRGDAFTAIYSWPVATPSSFVP